MLWPQKLVFLGFAALFTIVPLIFLPFTSELFEFNKIITTAAITIFIMFGWGSRCVLAKRLIFKRTLLDLPLLLHLLAILLSLLLSIDPQTSLLGYYGRWNGGLLSILMYSLLYWAFVSNLTQKSILPLINLSLFTAALVSTYGILQHFGIDDHLWVQDVKNRVFSTLGQPNWLAAYLIALIFIPIAKFLPGAKNSESLKAKPRLELTNLHLATFIALFVCLLFTKSRSGILAFTLCLIVFVILSLRNRQPQTLPPKKLILLLSTIFTLTVLVPNPLHDYIYKPLAPTKTTSPAATPETGGTESGLIRQIVWKGAINIWLDNPKTFLLGTGPETFALSYFLHRPIEHNHTSEWELLYNKAHNEFLNYLSTTGILGLGAYLLLLLSTLTLFLKLITHPPSAPTETGPTSLSPGLAAGWISISVTNFWGFSTVVPQLLLFLLPALAITLSSHPPHPPATTPKLNLPLLLRLAPIGLICLLGLYQISTYWLADFHYTSSQKAETAFVQTENIEHLITGYESAKSAYHLNPNEPIINLQLSTMAAYLSLISLQVDATASAQFAQLAQEISQRAVDLSPRSPSLRKSQAHTLILLSTVDSSYLQLALSALKSAQKLSPTDPRVPYQLGLVSQFMQDATSAATYYHSALLLKPDFTDAQRKLSELSSPSATPDLK